MSVGQQMFAGKDRCGIAGEERAIAIAILRINRLRAGCAAIWVGLANDDGFVRQFGIACHNRKTTIDILQLCSNTSFDVPSDKLRLAFSVKGHKVDWGTDGAGGIVHPAQAMVEKVAQELDRMCVTGAGHMRTAHPRGRQRPFYRIHCVVVGLVIFFWRALPIEDVWLVPHFPIPGFYFGLTVTLDAVLHPLKHQLSPFLIIVRWIGPASMQRIFATGNPGMLIRLRLAGQGFWHKANLHQRTQVAFTISVKDAVDERPVVMRHTIGIFSIGIGRTPFQGGRTIASGQ